MYREVISIKIKKKAKARGGKIATKRSLRRQEREKSKSGEKKYALQKSTQLMLPIADVSDGLIITKDKRYIKLMELSPINFLLRSNDEKNGIIYSFVGLLKSAPDKVHLKSYARKANVETLVSNMARYRAAESEENVLRLLDEHVDMLTDVALREGVTRRFFLMFEHEPSVSNRKETYRQIVASMNNVAARIQNNLFQCGNEVISGQGEDSAGAHDDYIDEFLYELINRREAETVPFEHRATDVINNYLAETGRSVDDPPYIPVTEYIAPKWADLTHGKYLVVDGKYYTFAYIPTAGYNTKVLAGWMSFLVNACEGIDVDIFLERVPSSQIQPKITRQIRLNRARLTDTGDTSSEFDDLGNSIESGMFIKSGLSEGEDFYYMSTLITIVGESLEEIDWKYNELEKQFISKDMSIKMCKFQMEQAFMSTLPLCSLDPAIKAKAKRNVLSYGAASAYPFISFELQDPDGIMLGTNKNNNSLVVTDNFNSRKYKNANTSILGCSGSGKTFLLQCLAMRMRMKGIQVFIVAPLSGIEDYRRACVAIGGEFCRISPGSPNSINIMEIRPTDEENSRLIDGDYERDSILAAKLRTLQTFFSLVIPEMTLEEAALLEEVLRQIYLDFGITADNKSLVDPQTGVYKKMPILGDVYEKLLTQTETKRMAVILRPFIDGSASSFNRQTNVNLNSLYTVLDLSALDGKLLVAGMFVALDFLWSKVREDRTKKKAIILDELWHLIGAGSNEMAAKYVLEIFKTVRKFGGAGIAATQDIGDFFGLDDGRYGRGILNNSSTKIIMQLEPDEAKRVQQHFKLTEVEKMAITKFERGNGLIAVGSNNVFVSFKSGAFERELITTDRSELEKIAARKKKEKLGVTQ